MLNKKLKYFFITPALLLSAGVSFAKPSIKSLTSEDSAKEAQSSKPTSRSRVSGKLNTHSIGVGIGQTFLGGDFEDNGDDSITLDLFYEYAASYSFDFLANLHYSKHKFKGRKSSLPGLNFAMKAKFYQIDNFSPFAVAGLGFYKPEVRRNDGTGNLVDSDSKLVFGYNLGVGCDLRLNDKFKVGVMWQLHNPFDVKQEDQAKVEGNYSKLMMTGFYTF